MPAFTETLTPEQFENYVQNIIISSGAQLEDFKSCRREKIQGKDGEYEIDVAARFKALNTNFLVLIECKYHSYPIKREVIQILRDRIESVGAQKGMVFSNAKFQRGAIEYAKAHNIALVKVEESGPVYLNYITNVTNIDFYSIPRRKNAWLVHIDENNNTINTLLGMADVNLILQELGFDIPSNKKNFFARISIPEE
jgi:hypothetical protein